jgi:hypothetical protein
MNTVVISPKKCQECEAELFGRSDKKFCNDGCRTNFYNRQHSEKNNLIRRVNSSLKKNRKVLNRLSNGDTRKLYRSLLLSEGFDFRYFTSIIKTSNGNTYKFCYDFGYLELDQDFILVVKNTTLIH